MWHGIEFQGQQFFHVGGSQHLALGLNHLQIGGHGISQAAFSGQGPGAALDSVHSKAAAFTHQALAAEGSHHAMRTEVADQFVMKAALHANAAQLAGTDIGMKIAETAEQHGAQILIANTGIQSLQTSIKMDTDFAYQGDTSEQDDANSPAKLPQPVNPEQVAETLYSQALTGQAQVEFIFLSAAGQPISQRIIVPPSLSTRQHTEKKKRQPHFTFCGEDIVPNAKAYYHCYLCSSHLHDYDICEVCVAGRGCSCPMRREHILYRKGLLSTQVSYGKLTQVKTRKSKQQGKEKEQKASPSLGGGWRPQWMWKRSKKPESEELSSSEVEEKMTHLMADEDEVNVVGSDSDSALLIVEEEDLDALFCDKKYMN